MDIFIRFIYDKRYIIIIPIFLILSTCFIYFQVKDHEFIDLDDKIYITENPYILSGLTLENIKWAFSISNKTDKTYWLPLTWISHMLDVQLWGIDAGGHHLTNLCLHIINTLLLFFILKKMTGAIWKSAFVASLFALHPINVDTVAWVAERKNLLSTSFWFIALLAYTTYAKRPNLTRYLVVIISYIIGLLAKPMLITFPFVLLLLDYWPLGRIKMHSKGSMWSCNNFMNNLIEVLKLQVIVDKIPMILITFISIYISVLSVKPMNATITMKNIPMDVRISNALVSYIAYIWKFIWPFNLAVYYPFPSTIPYWQGAGAFLMIVLISTAVLRAHGKYPYLPVGWFWFIGTIIPVSGIYQVGFWPAMADRWAYIPFIGLFIMVAWGVPELLEKWRHKKQFIIILSGISLSILMILSWKQLGYWQNSELLFEHNIEVNKNDGLTHLLLAKTLISQGDLDKAIIHCNESIKIDPSDAGPYNILGRIFRDKGELSKSVFYCSKAIQIDPSFIDAYNTLGVTFMHQDNFSDAIRMFSKVLEIEPGNEPANINMGMCLKKQGNVDEAIRYFHKALLTKPDSSVAHYYLAETLLSQGKIDESIDQYKSILKLDPNNMEVQMTLSNLSAKRDSLKKSK